MSPESSSPGDPTSLSLVPLPRAGLSLGRPHLPPRVGLVCVYVFPGRGLQGSEKGQRCGWFSRGQGSLLIPANRAWALQPPPAHPPCHLVLAKKWPRPSPEAAASGLHPLEQQLRGEGRVGGGAGSS